MRLIDVHAHYGEWFFPIRKSGERDVLNLAMKYGIEKVVFSSSLAITYDIVEGNRELKRLVDRYPNFYGYVVLNPNYPELSEMMIEECLSDPKFVGAKIHPEYTRQPVSSATNTNLLELVVKKNRKVVLLHT
jgi:predicted TIM-barrel fold metal-dependent hydrolase